MTLFLLPLLLLLDHHDTDNGDEAPSETDDNGDEEIRDPEKKQLSDEAAKWRKRFREAEATIQQLESGDGNLKSELRAARLESAFLRAAIAREEPIADLDAAWTLGEARGFFDVVKDDGEGMIEALDKIASRYPYLLDEDGDEQDRRPVPTKPSGRVVKSPRVSAPDRFGLEQRFPILRRRRGR